MGEQKDGGEITPQNEDMLGVKPGIVEGTQESVPEPKKEEETVSEESQPTEEAEQNNTEKKEDTSGIEENYKELERKLTQIGQENSELRKFYNDVMPTLETIQNDPELLDSVMRKIYPEQNKPDETQATQRVNEDGSPVVDIESVKAQILKDVEERQRALKDQIDYEKNVETYIEKNNIDNDMLTKIKRVVDEKNIDDIEVAHKYVLASEGIPTVDKKVAEQRAEDATSVSGPSAGDQGGSPKKEGIDDYIKSPFNPNSLF